MSLAACSLICKYVNFNLGIGEQAQKREVNRRNGREKEGGEGKSVFGDIEGEMTLYQTIFVIKIHLNNIFKFLC